MRGSSSNLASNHHSNNAAFRSPTETVAKFHAHCMETTATSSLLYDNFCTTFQLAVQVSTVASVHLYPDTCVSVTTADRRRRQGMFATSVCLNSLLVLDIQIHGCNHSELF